MTPDEPPLVTIVIPCLDEAGHIEECLRCARAQDYPPDRVELLVADGGSVDGTLELLRRLRAEDPRIRVLDNPERLQSAGLNAMIRRARGGVIVRMDVHADYAPDYVRRCVEALARTGADTVGGAPRPRAEGALQRAVAAALGSPLGVGGARHRSAEAEGFVDTVFLGAFPRRVFETVGLYDPRAAVNEDADINQRILEAGGRVYLSRDIVAHYYPRGSLRALARQYFRYGRGRARTLLKHGGLPTLRPAVPFLTLLAGLLLCAPPLAGLLPWALAAYALATAVEAVRVGRAAGTAAVPAVWAIFPLLHAAHGAGFAAGLARYALSPDWGPPERLAPLTDAAPRAAL